MAGFDVLRWRRKKDRDRPAPASTFMSAAGRDIVPMNRSPLDQPVLQPRRGPRSMTASAAPITVGNTREAMLARATRQGWQAESFAYLSGVGELRYAVTTSANAVSRVRLYPAVQLDPREPPIPLDEVGAKDMPQSVVNAATEDISLLEEPGHGLSGMQHNQSINRQAVGEYYLVGLPFDPDTGEESWTIRSIDEVVIDTDGRMYLRDRPPGFQGYDEPPAPLPPDAFVARCWDPDPRFRALATSQMRPLLESLEELMLASRMIRSTLRSRIAGSGVLLVPDALELLGNDPTNQDPTASPFFEELTKAMITPIQSEGDASEVVPMVVKGPADILKELRHLTLDRPFDQHAMAIRGELIRRLAIGLDWPPELLLGVGDVSHWAQWFIDESTFRYHYEPQIIGAVRQWTQAYTQPMLMARQWDAAAAEKANRVVWWYDPTELLTHPDRAKDAIQLYTMDVLNDEALLRACGFNPATDKPTESEFLIRLISHARSFPPNVVEAIVHRIDPSLVIPADRNEPGETPMGPTPPIGGGDGGGGAPSGGGLGGPGSGGPPAAAAQAAIERLISGGRDRIVLTTHGEDVLVADGAPASANTGAMVALYPTPEQAATLAVEGGEAADDLHVTLAYLGKAADLTPEQRAAAINVCSAVAGLHAPLAGVYGGVARFSASASSDGLDPVVALPDVQGLVALRNMLCEHLAAAGLPLPSERGFTAHTTLQYVDTDAPMPIERLDEPVPATFGHVSLVLGGLRSDFPMIGVAEPIVAAGADATVHAGASRKLGDIDRALRDRIRTAADAALRRQLEKANARLLSRLNGKPELRAAIKDVDPIHYAAVLGADRLAAAGIDPVTLLGDDYADLKTRVLGWIAHAQSQALDIAATIAPIGDTARASTEQRMATQREAAWDALSTALGRIAAVRLMQPDLPIVAAAGEHDPGFLVSASPIRAALAIAGGFGLAEGSQGLKDDGLAVDRAERLGGIGTGTIVNDLLTGAGASVVSWEWIYGASERPFMPHVVLDGATYTSHDDDALLNTEGWPETEYFYPGDHDGCFVAGTVVSGPPVLGSTDRRYVGPAVDLETSSGVRITATVNHPILTPRGWVQAGSLNVGDEVIEGGVLQGTAGADHDDRQMPARIEDVAAAVGVNTGVVPALVQVRPENFHGDGRFSTQAVVRRRSPASSYSDCSERGPSGHCPECERRLATSVERGLATSPRKEQEDHITGRARRHDRGSHASRSLPTEVRTTGLAPEPELLGAPSCDGGTTRPESLSGAPAGPIDVRVPGHSAGLDAVPDSGLGGLSGADVPLPTGVVDVRSKRYRDLDPDTSQGDSRRPSTWKDLTGETGTDEIQSVGESVLRLTGEVGVHKVTGLVRREIDTHVYNLQTTEGWYLAGTLVVHNCDCTEDPTWSTSAVPAAVQGAERLGAVGGETVAETVGVEAVDAGVAEAAGRGAVDRLIERHAPAVPKGKATPAQLEEAKVRLREIVAPRVDEAEKAGLSSDRQFAVKNARGKDVYTPERVAQQDALLKQMYADAAGVPDDGRAVMLGGIPGAGKSSSLAAAGIDDKEFLTLNPDDTRDAMLRSGMGIDVEGLSPRETSFLIHEEASELTQRLARMAANDRKNVIWDITMDPKKGANAAEGVERRLAKLEEAGYSTDMVFVRAAKEVALERALGRYAGQVVGGDPLGGRPTVGLLGRKSGQAGVTATNEDVFELVRTRAGRWWLYDNNGAAPRLVASG